MAMSLGVKANSSSDLCTFDKSQFGSFLGGAAAGTAVTASLAGEKIALIVLTDSVVLLGVAPVIAPVITLTAAGTATAYASLKTWCSRDVITETTMNWYQSSVINAADGMELAVDMHGQAVSYTSRVFEGISDVHKEAVDNTATSIEVIVEIHEDAVNSLADFFCNATRNC